MHKAGAYVLYLDLPQSLKLDIGILKESIFPAGFYAYVGSAARGIEKRISRHRRLASQKAGKIHWHIDHLLTHPDVRLVSEKALTGCGECAISQKIASEKDTTVPVPGFGSTDCKAGCRAHLYRVHRRCRSIFLPGRSK